MMPSARWAVVCSVTLGALSGTAAAQEATAVPADADSTASADAASGASLYKACRNACDEERQLSDLTILNFFSAGWDDFWSQRERHTPDMALLHVTTNFMEREFRIDYVFTAVNNKPKTLDSQLVDGLIAYGLDRRLMLEVVTNYQWNVSPRGAPPENGAAGAAVVRLQLVDTKTGSYAFQYKITTPNKGLGQTTTTMSYSLTGWQDIGAVLPALGRFGLYYSFTYDNQLGFHEAGATLNDFTYDVSFAETWTSKDTPILGNFTTFLEFAGVSNLDGTNASTTLSLTPGIRFWVLPRNSLMFGIDFPLTTNPPYSIVYRLTYILNF
jgi:hypothetical protein